MTVAARVTPDIRASMHRLASSVVHDPSLADAIVQDAVCVAADSYETDKPRSFSGWIMSIVHSLALRLLRRRKIEDRAAQEFRPAVDPVSAARAAMGRESLRLVGVGLEALTPPQRAALDLRVFGDLSYEAIGERLGIAAGAARALVWRAREALSRTLSRLGVMEDLPPRAREDRAL